MRYPDFLKEKGTIGFSAPSFGCAMEPYRTAFENAQRKWKALGYGLDLGPNCYKQEGVGISSTPEACGRELTECYLSRSNDCLISCGGGELMCEILDYVDFETIKDAPPKWFMGYSDNTNMTFLLNTLCDTAAIYGPCASSFGMEPWHPCLTDAMDLLEGKRKQAGSYGTWEKEGIKDEDHPLAPYQCEEELRLKLYTPNDRGGLTECRQVEMEGRLIGGCMDCLVNLLGTSFDRVEAFAEKYREDGFIWFLEACDLNVFGIRRAMWQMEHAGWFRHIKGFLIGRPVCFGEDMMGLDQYEAILPVARHYGIPVIMDADLGHLPPMMPLVSGSMAKIKAEGNRLQIQMEYR